MFLPVCSSFAHRSALMGLDYISIYVFCPLFFLFPAVVIAAIGTIFTVPFAWLATRRSGGFSTGRIAGIWFYIYGGILMFLASAAFFEPTPTQRSEMYWSMSHNGALIILKYFLYPGGLAAIMSLYIGRELRRTDFVQKETAALTGAVDEMSVEAACRDRDFPGVKLSGRWIYAVGILLLLAAASSAFIRPVWSQVNEMRSAAPGQRIVISLKYFLAPWGLIAALMMFFGWHLKRDAGVRLLSAAIGASETQPESPAYVVKRIYIFLEGAAGDAKLCGDIAGYISSKLGSDMVALEEVPICLTTETDGVDWPPSRAYVFAVLSRYGTTLPNSSEQFIFYDGKANRRRYYAVCCPD